MDETRERSLYFAYGANLNPEIMKRRCPDSSFMAVAYSCDYILKFTKCLKRDKSWGKGSWVADMALSLNDKVWGAIYKVSEKDLENLDKSEGVRFPTGYKRVKQLVIVEKSNPLCVDVWTYLVNKKQGEGRPSKLYMAAILEGAREHQLPEDYIKFLESIETMD